MKNTLRFALVALAALCSKGTWAQEAGTYYLQNVEESTLWMDQGNDWGTHITATGKGLAITLAKISDGVYTLDGGVSNGGNNHFFTGEYCDGAATNFTFEPQPDGSYAIKNTAGYLRIEDTKSGFYFNVAPSATNDTRAHWKLYTAAERLAYVQANATKTNPIEITYLYRQTGFNRSEVNISNAWQGTAFDVRARDNGGNWNGNAEHWNRNYDSYQIATVPDGLYSLKVQGFYRMGSAENAIAQRNAGTEALNAIFYANNKEKTLMSILDAGSGLPGGNTYTGFEGKVPNSNVQARTCFNAGHFENELTEAVVTNGTLKIGVKKTSLVSGDWTVVDNFRIFYHGEDLSIYQSAFNEAKANATSAAAQPMTEENRNIINAEIAAAQSKADTGTKQALIEATNDLAATTEKANRFATAYATAAAAQALLDAGNKDFTSLIVNPDFDGTSTTGWSSSNGGNAANNGNFALCVGPFAEKWTPSNSASNVLTDGTFTQTLLGLPAGIYTLSVDAQNIQQGDASVATGGFFLTANTQQTEIGYASKYSVIVELTAGQELTIGTKLQNCTGNWICFDSFRMTYAANADEAASQAVAAAEALGQMKADVQAALDNAKNALGTATDKMAAITALLNAMVPAQNSANAYAYLKAQMDKYPIRTAYESTGYDALNNAKTGYEAGTLSNDECNTSANSLRDAYRTYTRGIANSKHKASAFATNAVITTATTDNTMPDGWTYTEGLNPANHQTVNSPASTMDYTNTSQYLAECWRSGGLGEGNIYQTVNNLPAGKYALRAVAFTRNNRAGDHIYIKSGSNQATEILMNAGQALASLTDPIEVAAGQSVEIGLHHAGGSDWACIGNAELICIELADLPRDAAANKYGTICLPYNARVKSGAKAYTATVNDKVVELAEVSEGTNLAKGTAYIFQATDANQVFEAVLDADLTATATTGNTLTGVFAQTQAPVGSYVLQTNDEDRQNFFIVVEGKQPSVPAYRAYLNAPNAGGRAFISFADNNTTAIQALEALTNNKAEIYDLNGRKLPKLQKGVNIVNGTKIIVK